MDPNSPEAQNYLAELFQMTAGDISAQVSMYDVGAALNLDKDAAGKIAEDLIGDGLVEVKTLSGGIGITAQGIERLKATGLAKDTTAAGLTLGLSPILEEDGKKAVAAILEKIKTHLSQDGATYARIEEMVIDIKTVEVQMLSPRPKTGIVREVLRSLGDTLDSIDGSDIAGTIEKMIAV